MAKKKKTVDIYEIAEENLIRNSLLVHELKVKIDCEEDFWNKNIYKEGIYLIDFHYNLLDIFSFDKTFLIR